LKLPGQKAQGVKKRVRQEESGKTLNGSKHGNGRKSSTFSTGGVGGEGKGKGENGKTEAGGEGNASG